MIFRFTCVVLSLYLLFFCIEFTSAGIVPQKLSVLDAVEIARVNSITLKQNQYAKLDAVSNYRKVSMLTSYNVTAESSLSRQPSSGSAAGIFGTTATYLNPFGSSVQLTMNPLAVGTSRGAFGVTVNHPLMRGGGIYADRYNQLQNAKSSLVVQEKSLQNAEKSTIVNVVSAYYQAVLARAQVEIQRNAVKSAQDSAEFLRRKVDAGFEAGIGLTQADVAVMQAKESLNDAISVANSATDALMLAMGVGVGQSPELIDDVPNYDPPLPSLDEAISKALTNRIEVLQLKENIGQQKRALAIAEDQMRMGISFTASWNSSILNPGFIGSSILDLGSSFVGMKVAVPVDKRSLAEDRAISARSLNLMEKQRSFQDQQLANNVRNAYHAVEKARASVANLSENEKIVNLQQYQARRRLEEGLGTSFDLVKAQNDQASFNVQLKSAKVNLYLAHLQLQLSTGDDVEIVGAK